MRESFFYWLTRGQRGSLISSFPPMGWPMTQEPLPIAAFGHAQPLAEEIPGYSANNATDEGTTQVTTTPIPSHAGINASSLGQWSAGTDCRKKCGCIVCLGIGIFYSSDLDPHHCRFANCNWVYEGHSGWYWGARIRVPHEKTHHQRGPKNLQTPFSCLVGNCRYTSKRWPDLLRHTTHKHCNNPAKFACSVIGCKYNGEGNGFTRKDKLMDHCKSMHQGQKIPGKAVRAIRPAPASPYAEASGASNVSAQGE